MSDLTAPELDAWLTGIVPACAWSWPNATDWCPSSKVWRCISPPMPDSAWCDEHQTYESHPIDGIDSESVHLHDS